MAIEAIEKEPEGSRKLVGLTQTLAPPLCGLLPEHGAPVAVHRGVVGGNQLRRHHTFQFVFWIDAGERRDCGAQLPVARLRVGVLKPERMDGLIGQKSVPVVISRSADLLQLASLSGGVLRDNSHDLACRALLSSAPVHSFNSHAGAGLDASNLRRRVCRAPPCVSIVAVFSESATSLSPLSIHSSPALSTRAKGRSRPQPNKSDGPQPSAAAFSTQPASRNRPTSSTNRSQRFSGSSAGARSGSSRAKPSAQAPHHHTRRSRRARPLPRPR